MKENSLLDLIYHYLIALDNDKKTIEKKKQIIEKLKSYTKGKVPVYHFVVKCIDSIRDRTMLKEIGDLIMSNMEDENLFYEDYVESKEKLNYYNHIYLPSLDNHFYNLEL